MIQYLILLIALLITIREGLQQRDRVEHTKLMSNLWHGVGLIMRVAVFVLLYLITNDVVILTITGVILFVLYSISCSIGSKQKWYYVSNRGIDKLIRKLFFFVNFNKGK
jgi:NhaP-type Na+/H+ or K+/H+ antiporter